jgi:hypothetical protein
MESPKGKEAKPGRLQCGEPKACGPWRDQEPAPEHVDAASLEDIIDAAQAARILDVRREHVTRLLQQGLIPGRLLTSTWITTRAAVDAYARERRPRGRPPRISSIDHDSDV